MPTVRFRLGKLEEGLPDDKKALPELGQSIIHNHFPIVEERQNHQLRRGSRSPHYEDGEESEDIGEFFYFRYVSEIVRTSVGLDEDGEDKENDNVARDTMEFLLLNDGRFIYESATDVSPGQAFEVLFKEQLDYVDDISIPNSVIRDFYRDNNQIREVVVHGIDGEPADDEPMRSVIEAGQVGDRIAFNAGGDPEANLKKSSLVENFVDKGDLKRVAATNPEQNQKTVSENNWVMFYYPEAMDEGVRSRLIYNRVKPILDGAIPPER